MEGGAHTEGFGRAALRSLAHVASSLARRGERRLEHVLGGPARMYVIVLLACVLGLETADLSAVGSAASELRSSLQIDNTELGLLVALPSVTAAVASIPVGMLTDRFRRVPLLAFGVVLWAGAMIACASAGSFDELLTFRLALGAVTAVAGPTIASLTGDFFVPSERSRVYGFILAGELIGTGFGLLVSGELATVFGWRAAFWSLAPFALVLAWFLVKLPEPDRGGTSRLRPGAMLVSSGGGRVAGEAEDSPAHDPAMVHAVSLRSVDPLPELVLDEDPSRLSLRRAVRYILEVKTNVAIIVASALGYFFTAGVRTFGVLFLHLHYEIPDALSTLMLMLVSVGALVGTIGGGRLCDALIGRGHVTARLLVGGWGFIVAAALLVPGVLVSRLTISMPLLIVAGVALSAPNPAIDAARLDVIHSRLWGRAEGVRTLLRTAGVAIAPLLFGFVSDLIGGGGQHVAEKSGYGASAAGLQYTFVIMVLPMVAAGVVLLRARSRYPSEVASALAWEQRTGTDEGDDASVRQPGRRLRRRGRRR